MIHNQAKIGANLESIVFCFRNFLFLRSLFLQNATHDCMWNAD